MIWDDVIKARQLLKEAGFNVTRVNVKFDHPSWSDSANVTISHTPQRFTASLAVGELDGLVYVRRGMNMGHIQSDTHGLIKNVQAAIARHNLVKSLDVPPHGRVKYAEV